MTRPSRAGILLLGIAVACCTGPPHPADRADQAAIAACRSRADEVYLKQNRDLVSRQERIDSPLSSSGVDTLNTAGLAGRYERDSLFDACIKGVQAQTAPQQRPPAAQNPPAAASVPKE
jgi:hypothetical protein